MPRTQERAKKSKARAVLGEFAAIFCLWPWTVESVSGLSQAVLAGMWVLFTFAVTVGT